MPLECICATSASSWSFTDPSLSLKNAVKNLFPVFRACMAQFDHAVAELLPQSRGRKPACSASRRLKVTRPLRSRQLRRIRSKCSYGHEPHRDNDHSPHQSKSSTKKPVNPT